MKIFLLYLVVIDALFTTAVEVPSKDILAVLSEVDAKHLP